MQRLPDTNAVVHVAETVDRFADSVCGTCGWVGGCRKAVRATLILIPLLGLQYMLFPMRPRDDSALHDLYLGRPCTQRESTGASSGALHDLYLVTVAVVTSLQVRSLGGATAPPSSATRPVSTKYARLCWVDWRRR